MTRKACRREAGPVDRRFCLLFVLLAALGFWPGVCRADDEQPPTVEPPAVARDEPKPEMEPTECGNRVPLARS